MAEARLAAILDGDDPLVNITPSHVTFRQACDEHLRYLEHDRLSPARAKALTAVVNEVCSELRPHAGLLVEGFGIPDAWVTTEMTHDLARG